MDIEELVYLFEKHHNEYLDFEEVTNKRSNRPDIHAFLLLDELQPDDDDIICASTHDQFFLNINVEKLAEVITEEHIIELRRCGVMINSTEESLYMFT